MTGFLYAAGLSVLFFGMLLSMFVLLSWTSTGTAPWETAYYKCAADEPGMWYENKTGWIKTTAYSGKEVTEDGIKEKYCELIR